MFRNSDSTSYFCPMGIWIPFAFTYLSVTMINFWPEFQPLKKNCYAYFNTCFLIPWGTHSKKRWLFFMKLPRSKLLSCLNLSCFYHYLAIHRADFISDTLDMFSSQFSIAALTNKFILVAVTYKNSIKTISLFIRSTL